MGLCCKFGAYFRPTNTRIHTHTHTYTHTHTHTHTNFDTLIAISIHWHGQEQHGTPWMDGFSGISNCPIPPHSSFTYAFHVNEFPGLNSVYVIFVNLCVLACVQAVICSLCVCVCLCACMCVFQNKQKK